jgi:predicted transposase/invertase (TIGR01784 family)
MYNNSLKVKWDNKNVLDYALKEGIEKGRLEGKLEEAKQIAAELKKEGLPLEFISKTTKLSIEVIEKL